MTPYSYHTHSRHVLERNTERHHCPPLRDAVTKTPLQLRNHLLTEHPNIAQRFCLRWLAKLAHAEH